MADIEDDLEGARSFARFFEQLANGDAHDHASDELHALGVAMRDEASARSATVSGELTIKLKFKAEPGGVVTTAYEVKRKDPPRSTSKGVMWITPGGNFTPQNPRQQSLPGIREVKPAAEPPREVEPRRGMKEV